MPDPTTPIIALAEQFRRALEKQDAAALNRLISAYRLLYANFQARLEQYVAKYGLVDNAAGRRALRQLIEDVGLELQHYSSFVGTEIQLQAGQMVEQGIAHSRAMVGLGNPALVAKFRTLAPGVIRTLLGFLDTNGPLYARLDKLAPTYAKALSDAILEGIAMGKGPRDTARLLVALTNAGKDQLGMALTDSMRMMRTVQLYAYRETTRASYLANPDIVSGWIWYAHLDGDVCMSCAAMHGTFHENSENLDDHHNGRCAMLPVLVGQDPGSVLAANGEEWFNGLSEAEQAQRMGKDKLAAYKDGKFSFANLSAERVDDVYGTMRSEASLKDLIGE